MVVNLPLTLLHIFPWGLLLEHLQKFPVDFYLLTMRMLSEITTRVDINSLQDFQQTIFHKT